MWFLAVATVARVAAALSGDVGGRIAIALALSDAEPSAR